MKIFSLFLDARVDRRAGSALALWPAKRGPTTVADKVEAELSGF